MCGFLPPSLAASWVPPTVFKRELPMRRLSLWLTAAAFVVACDPATQPVDPAAAGANPVSPATSAPSLGATVLKIPNNYFLIYDEDPTRNYTVTFGLVSPPSDLDACG